MNPSSGAGRVDLKGDVIDDSRGYEEVVKKRSEPFDVDRRREMEPHHLFSSRTLLRQA